jgi:hypothetical protein
MESKKINQLATELTPALSDLTIIGDPTTGISKKITLSQMASLFTGTVEEYANVAAFPLVGVADTIYIALDTNVLYRWDTGLTSYVELSPNIINSLVFSDANGFDGNISLVGSVATLTITTALTQGSVPFIGTSGALTQDNANLFFDDTNNRLGINTNSPTTALDIFGSGIIGRVNGTSTNNAFLGFASAGTNKWSIGNVQSDHRFRIYNDATTSELVSVLQTGEFGIGIANPTTKIHIDGGASALIANLDANVSVAKSISFRSDNSNRINLEVSGTESGSNAGANFFIRRYSDAGALIDTPFTITRSTGEITLAGALNGTSATFSNNLSAMGSNIQFNLDATFGTNYYTMGFGGVSNGFNRIAGGTGTTDGLYITSATGRDIAFRTNGGGLTNMLINSVGNVGIGTTSIGARLELRTSADEDHALKVTYATASNGRAIWINQPNGGGGGGATQALIYANNSGNNRYVTFDSVFTILKSGNVGIGTTDPNVYGFGGALFTLSTTSTYANMIIATSGTNGAGISLGNQTIRRAEIEAADGSSLVFKTNTGNSGTGVAEKMRITSGGFVGIGTTSPSAKFMVLSDTNTSATNIARFAAANNTLAVGIGYETIRQTETNGSLLFETNATERMRISPNGNVNVGIGSALLEIGSTGLNGKLGVRFGGAGRVGIDTRDDDDASNCIFIFFRKSDGTGIGSITRNGLTNAVLYNTTSDYRLKEDFKEINGLDKIAAIKVYDFKWKGLEDRMDGVIAHELAEIMPYAVHGEKDAIDEKGNIVYQGVDYSKIVPSLIKAIQELKLEIDILKAKIK